MINITLTVEILPEDDQWIYLLELKFCTSNVSHGCFKPSTLFTLRYKSNLAIEAYFHWLVFLTQSLMSSEFVFLFLFLILGQIVLCFHIVNKLFLTCGKNDWYCAVIGAIIVNDLSIWWLSFWCWGLSFCDG